MATDPAQTTLVGPDTDQRDIRTVVADPPWNCERGAGESKRGADKHYPLLKPREIVHVIQQDCPAWRRLADTAHLYLWATNTAFATGDMHFVARRLGFEPKSILTWCKENGEGKPQIGLGHYFRTTTEQLVFCVRGEHMETSDEDVIATHHKIPKSDHSRKPDYFYQLVEQASPGEYLELFARREREGWTCWGDEC